MDGRDWAAVNRNDLGWAVMFKQLVKSRRELVVGETKLRAFLAEGGARLSGVFYQGKLVFWDSEV